MKRLGAIAVLVCLSFTVGAAGLPAPPATAAAAGSVVHSHQYSSATPPGFVQASWVPWDVNKITTLQKCMNRLNFLVEKYGIPRRAMRCKEYQELPPCSGSYWLVEIDQDAAVAAMFGSRVAFHEPAATAC